MRRGHFALRLELDPVGRRQAGLDPSEQDTATLLADLSIEAPPPRYPPKKYCDMTGLEAPYTDPKACKEWGGPERPVMSA